MHTDPVGLLYLQKACDRSDVGLRHKGTRELPQDKPDSISWCQTRGLRVRPSLGLTKRIAKY